VRPGCVRARGGPEAKLIKPRFFQSWAPSRALLKIPDFSGRV